MFRFCAVAETSETEFSDIDLSQKVRRRPSYMALFKLVPYSVARQEWSMMMANNQSVWKWNTKM